MNTNRISVSFTTANRDAAITKLNDAPTFDDVDNLRNKVNELISGLRR